MNVKKRIILISLVGLVALGTLSVSFSLAWYVNSSQLLVDPVKIQFKTERDLRISTSEDLDTFKDEVTYEELDGARYFAPVSSMYSSLWLENKENKPTYYDCSYYDLDINNVPVIHKAKAGKDYFNQDFYLICDDDVYVTIDAEKSKIEPLFNNAYAQEIKEKYPDLSVEEITARLDNLVKAMRFSVLVTGEDYYSYQIFNPNSKIDEENEDDVVLGGILDNDNNNHLYFDSHLENDGIYENVYGEIINREKIIYDDALDEDTDFVNPNEDSSAFNAKHQKGVHPFNLEKSISNGLEIAKENSLRLEELDKNTELFYFPVYREQIRKVNISIYIEGWDLDSVNYTMGASFTSFISFKIYREF